MSWYGDPMWLADVLRAAGQKVIETPGWQVRGHGDFKQITHVMWHHTAGGGSRDWEAVLHGTNGLKGPLSQLVLERDGTWRIICVGVAWHAGRGSYPGLPTNNANYHAIGIEAVNNGRGQPWPEVQRRAYREGTAAILKRIGRDSSGVVGHKEYSSEGKIDPYPFDMNDERRRVQAILDGLNKPKPIENKINKEASIAKAWIGNRLHPEERPCKDGVGRYVDYENGSIYWHPKVAGGEAIAVPKLVYEVWERHKWEQGHLGYPTQRHVVINGGDIQSFQGGVIYRKHGTAGASVHGVIGDRWFSEGAETGPYGWPTGEEVDRKGGKSQDFENGTLAWHPSNAVEVDD